MFASIEIRPSAKRPRSWWVSRIVLMLALLSLTGASCLAVLAMVAKSGLSSAHPPTGQLVDIGGYRMHINCMGNGPQTVVFEAGNADFSVHWAKVQSAVATFARACTYDRAGLGWSDPSPHERSALVMIDELHALLGEAGVGMPIVLVGHSFGAVNARLFAQAYSDEVVGLVLVDPAHESQMDRLPAMHDAVAAAVDQFRGLVPVADYGLLALMPDNVPNRGLPREAQNQYVAILATTDYFRTAATETAALAENLVSAGAATDLGDLPVTVISRGLPEPIPGASATDTARFERIWAEMQSELLSLSTQSRQIIAVESGHDIPLEQPEIVIDAIRQILTITQ